MIEFQQNVKNVQIFFDNHPWLLVAILIWSLVWKGLALWKAGRLSHKKWFMILLVINDIGILDIIYLYFVAKKYTVLSETEVE